MWISKYFVYFVIFSVMGWVYESAFCTIKTGKWQNRGFLYGPLCPIYGVGATAITFIVDELMADLSDRIFWKYCTGICDLLCAGKIVSRILVGL